MTISPDRLSEFGGSLESARRLKTTPEPFTAYTDDAPLRSLLTVLFKRKRLIAGVCLLCVAGTTGWALFRQKVYEAKAQVFIKPARESAIDPTRSDRPSQVFVQQAEVVHSEKEIIKSRMLSEQVLASLGPDRVYPALAATTSASDTPPPNPEDASHRRLLAAADIMQGNLVVENIRNSSLIDIRFRHQEPETAARVVNALVDKYIERHIDIHKVSKSYPFFKHQSEELKARLSETEIKLKGLKEDRGITSFEEQQTLLLQQESKLRDDLSRAMSQHTETTQRVSDLRRKLAVTPEKLAQGEQTNPNALLINTLESRMVELELREKELLHRYSDDSRLVQNVREELRIVREKLEAREQKKYESSAMGINPNYQLLQREILMDESQLTSMKTRIDNLQRQLARIVQDLERLNALKDQYNRLKKEFDIDQDSYKLYLGRLEESRISAAMDDEKISNVRAIETARPPLRPLGPSSLIVVLAATIAGLLGGALAALMVEFLQQRVERPEEVEALLGVPVLSSIPELTPRTT